MNTSKEAASRGAVRPRTDILETDDALALVADLPGVDESALELSLTDDVLTLRAKPAAAAPEGWDLAWTEFEIPESYERSFRLAADIDREKIGATLRDGRLAVTLVKRQPRANRIPVRTS